MKIQSVEYEKLKAYLRVEAPDGAHTGEVTDGEAYEFSLSYEIYRRPKFQCNGMKDFDEGGKAGIEGSGYIKTLRG